jgi:hypothetical protein
MLNCPEFTQFEWKEVVDMLFRPTYNRRRALIIGINRYKNVSPLSYAANDADGLVEILKNRFGFVEDDITVLKDNTATKDNIIQEFHGFTQNNTDPDDKLLLFFAGHGHTIAGNRGQEGFLVPVDGTPGKTSTLIRWDDLTRNAELIKAKHILFIMDACYGGLAITRAPAVGSRRFLRDMCQRYSRQVITAGKADESVADAGGPLAGHSIFTGYLLDGLNGAAATEAGIITANGIMAYVYEKVGNDSHSHQTPHYGYVEGDGDFIFTDELLNEIEPNPQRDNDILIEIPSTVSNDLSEPSISTRIKELISQPSQKIELHDFTMKEVRKFLDATSKKKMPLDISPLTNDALINRLKNYEDAVENLSHIFCIISHWGEKDQALLIEKMMKRLTDNNSSESGLTILLNMRWYPICLIQYVAGISAIAGGRYDNLLRILNTPVDCKLDSDKPKNVIVPTVNALAKLHDIFKLFPGHERNFVPKSEYLFKLLQPKIEYELFLGNGYEPVFDRFEIFLALVYADVADRERGPMGRFGWKTMQTHESIYGDLLKEAEKERDRWPPLKAGLFNSSYERFKHIWENILKLMQKVSWF